MAEIPANQDESLQPELPVGEPETPEDIQQAEPLIEVTEPERPRPTTIPQEPMAQIKLAANLDVRTDKLVDEPENMQELLNQLNEHKKSVLTKETLRRINYNRDSAWTDPEMWNDLTSGISALQVTDRLEDEKADLLFENMFNEDKDKSLDRQMRIAEINEQLHGMRSGRTSLENFAFDSSKVFYDLFQSAKVGAMTGAGLGGAGLLTAPVTGVGAIPLAMAGAVGGFAKGMMSHMVYDGYIKASSSMYEQLGNVVNEKGETLTQEEKRNIAMGTGAVATAIGFFGNLPIIKNTPLGKMFNGETIAAKLVSQAGYRPEREALKKIGTSLALNGTAEGMTVYVNKIGEAIGQAEVDGQFDKKKFWDTVANLGNLEEAAYSAAVATVGVAPLSAISYKGMVRREADAMIVDRAGEFNRMILDGVPENQIPDQYQPQSLADVEAAIEGRAYDADIKAVENKISESMLAAKRDLDYYDTINNVIEVFKKPEMQDKSTRQKVGAAILEAAGIDHLYIDPIKMGQIVVKLDNDSIRQRVEEQLGRNLTDVTAAPLKVSAIDFINMAHEAPMLKDAFLRTSSSEIAETANSFIKKVGDTVQKFKEQKDVKALDMINDIVFTEHPNGSSLPYGTKNYHDFLKLQEIVPEEVWSNLTDNERAELNSIVNPAKIEVIRDLNLDRKEIKDDLLDVTRLKLIEEQKKLNQTELYKDQDRKVIDAYMDSVRKDEPILWRIKPSTLDPKLKKRFLENQRLADLRVFDETNGRSIEDVTEMLGYESNYHTLETLSSAFSTGELEFMAAESNKFFIDGEVVDVASRFDDVAHIEKQLSESQKVMRQVAEKQLDIINKKTEGSVEKKVIFRLPKNETIDYYVRETVENNSIYDLGDETQYTKMVKKHQMSAWKHMRDGDYKKATEAWTSALYANRMAAEVRVARQRVFKLANVIKELGTEPVKKMFQQAGGDTEQAGRELYELFTVPNAEVRKIEAYRQAQKAKGIYVPPIRARRNKRQLVDLTQMSGGEVRDLLQLSQGLMKQADVKSELVIRRNNKEEQISLQDDRVQIMNSMDQLGRPNKRSVVGRGFGWIKTLKDTYVSGPTNVGTLAAIVDGYKIGTMSRLIQDIKAQYDMAEVAKQNLNAHIQSMIGEFEVTMGKGAFEKMGSKEVFVQEFADSRELRYGKMTERELFGMLAHIGNESSRRRLENFKGFTADDLQGILEHHLSEAHFDIMQKFWDIYETFKDPITQVNKDVWGFSDTQFIAARDFEAHGKIYRGGYYPAIAETKGTTLWLERMLGNHIRRDREQVGEVNYKYAGIEDFTNTDRLKTRTEDTKHILSLDPEHLIYSYSALVHDVHMRPILDYAGKLFYDRKFLEKLNGFFGNETDSAEFVRYLEAMGDNSHASQKSNNGVLIKALRGISKSFVVAQLALKPFTILAQQFAHLQVPTQLKNKKAYFPELMREFQTIVSNPMDFSERVKFFTERDPQLLKAFDEINDLNQQAVTMFGKPRYGSPSDGITTQFINKKLNFLSQTRDNMMKATMSAIKYSDVFAQIAARSTLYRMGMEGKLEAEGVKAGDDAASMDFAKRVSERTVTGNAYSSLSGWLRDPATKLFMMTFMSQLNLSYNLFRENANRITDDYRSFRKDQETSVLEALGKTATSEGVQNIGFILLSTSIFPAIIQGFFSDDEPEDVAKNIATGAFSPFPLFNGAAFALANQWSKSVIPIQQQADMVVETAQFYFNLMAMKRNSKKQTKSAFITTGAFMGLPSVQMWNTMMSPEARSNWRKAGRATVGAVLGQYQSMTQSDLDELTPEEKEMFDFYMETLQQLEAGNMQPLHEINEAIKAEPSIQSGEQESPIPSNDFERTEPTPKEQEFKPLTPEEKVGVVDWFKKILKTQPVTPSIKSEDEIAPIQQEAPAEDSAANFDDDFLPSAGSTVNDSRQLESVARIYAKSNLNSPAMSKSAFSEYSEIRDEYLSILNDPQLSEDNKLMRLSALVVAKGEDFRAVAYDDRQPNKVLRQGDQIKGVLTIGYGFTKGVKIGDTMTEEQGIQRLMTELESRVRILNNAERKHNLNLNINQRVALISTIYNGAWVPDSYKNSTAAIKRGKFEPLLANTLESSSQTHINGLLKRRLLEYLIFNVSPPVVRSGGKNNLTARLDRSDTVIR